MIVCTRGRPWARTACIGGIPLQSRSKRCQQKAGVIPTRMANSESAPPPIAPPSQKVALMANKILSLTLQQCHLPLLLLFKGNGMGSIMERPRRGEGPRMMRDFWLLWNAVKIPSKNCKKPNVLCSATVMFLQHSCNLFYCSFHIRDFDFC